MAIRLAILAILAIAAVGPSAAGTEGTAPWFVDAAAAAGVSFRHANGARGEKAIAETMGSGVCFFAFAGEGRADLYFVNSAGAGGLYRNHGDGTFREALDAGGRNAGYALGCAAGDYDDDGDTDLYVTAYGPNTLYRNDSGLALTDVTTTAGVGDPRLSTGAAFADVDLDGDLDLYVANYVRLVEKQCVRNDTLAVYCGPESFDTEDDVLYLNRGDGRFADATSQSGLVPGRAKELGALFVDVDDDGDVDLFVAGDRTSNLLYENEGGRFTETSLVAGVAYNEAGKAEAGMGVAAGDVDDDGRADLFVTNFQWESNTLYRNEGGGFFVDTTAAAALASPSVPYMGWGTAFLDYDNDGDRDLFVANGHLDDNVELYDRCTYAQRNQLFSNDGTGRFADVSSQAGPAFQRLQVGRGAAVADYDDDGDIDIAVNNNGGPANLLRNDSRDSGHWLRVRLSGSASNRDAVGAVLRLRVGHKVLRADLPGGGSYLSQSFPAVHFGLGTYGEAAELEIRWPAGGIQRLRSISADRELQVSEPAP